MDTVMIRQLAELFAKNPHLRNKIIYKDTGRVNITALREELARLQFAADAANDHAHHVPSRGARGGGPKLRMPTPGSRSQAKPSYNW